MNAHFQHFSVGSLRRRLGDAISPTTIVQIYLEESPALIDSVSRALAAGGLEGLGAAAHRIKGSLAMLCAEQSTQIAESVVEACRNRDSQAARARGNQLLSSLRALRLELERYMTVSDRAV